jgi:hypothetical protein
MKAIETRWKGWRFRSRTEARWAVFLEAAGIAFEYESEGFRLSTGLYLPDFRLTQFPSSSFPSGWARQEAWLEIKPSWPSDEERAKCAELAAETCCPVLIAMGVPDFAEQVLIYEPDWEPHMRELLSAWAGVLSFVNVGSSGDETIGVGRGPLSADEIAEMRSYLERHDLQKDDEIWKSLAPFHGVYARVLGMRPGQEESGSAYIGLNDTLRRAFDAARGARFEFGQTDKRWDA